MRKSLKTFNEFLDIPIWPDMSFAKQKAVANAIINYLKKIIFMNILGVILARKGSKGIKNKNHLKLNGKSLINIAIKNAKNSKKITKLIFSTDDKKLRNEAIKLGINSPFLRPKKLANDKASSFSVLKHSIEWLKKMKIGKQILLFFYSQLHHSELVIL